MFWNHDHDGPLGVSRLRTSGAEQSDRSTTRAVVMSIFLVVRRWTCSLGAVLFAGDR